MNKPLFALLFLLLPLCAISAERPDLKKFFDSCGVTGSFILFDLNKNSTTVYNPERCKEQFTPASTYKIFNSLVGLETRAVKNEHDTIRWDKVKRPVPDWNRDHDMKSAFRFSVVWFYQEIARRVGEQSMQHYIDTVKYGNRDISGGIDKFWLQGGLRISQQEQIDLLVKLYRNQLPFSPHTMETVKKIMIMDDTLGYVLHAKTGYGEQEGKSILWYVGYLERGKDVYFFATNFETVKVPDDMLKKARREITMKIVKELVGGEW